MLTHRPALPARTVVHPTRVGRDRGAVTAEFALLMPVLVTLLAALLAAATAGVAKLQCIDAARAGARAAARHEDPHPLAAAAGPEGATIRVSVAGDLVTVKVTAEVTLPLPWHPRIGLGAQGTAQVELEAGTEPAVGAGQESRTGSGVLPP